jgi:proteasome lid subunit RPN8/RPN11
MMRLRAGLWAQIEAHCLAAAPEEAVGYLAAVRGAEDDITDVITVLNVADEPHARYEVADHEQLAVWQLLEEQHKRPVVTYHSHVGAPAVMSDVDIEMARDSRMLHLVVSVVPGVGVVDVCLYRVEWHAGAPVVVGPKWQCERPEGWVIYRAFSQASTPAKES